MIWHWCRAHFRSSSRENCLMTSKFCSGVFQCCCVYNDCFINPTTGVSRTKSIYSTIYLSNVYLHRDKYIRDVWCQYDTTFYCSQSSGSLHDSRIRKSWKWANESEQTRTHRQPDVGCFYNYKCGSWHNKILPARRTRTLWSEPSGILKKKFIMSQARQMTIRLTKKRGVYKGI